MMKQQHLWQLLRKFYTSPTRLIDSSKNNLPKEFVIFTEDLIICWHPEKKFPYECSKPLPERKLEPATPLKTSFGAAAKMFTRPKAREIVAEELAKITHTTKHIWFPRARDKKAKKTPPNRPYL